jgi:hypothetical protein
LVKDPVYAARRGCRDFNPAPFHALAKITIFLAKYRKTALVSLFRKRRDESAR